jgi:hypothetical protein
MMDFYKGTIPIIDDTPGSVSLLEPGAEYGKGYVERDYSIYPEEMFQHPNEMNLYDESEWDALYDAQEEQESSLEHLYLRGGKPAFVNLDQNGHGYCWAYSTGHCCMMLRLINNQPMVRYNPHSVAAIIKGGADQGGWCGLSEEFLRTTGIATEEKWPTHSRDVRRYDTPAMREHMANHKVMEDWVDLTRPAHSRNMVVKNVATSLFNNTPGAYDFNHWGHSVCGLRWVRVERNSWGLLILNSWKNWGRFGLAVLRGGKEVPNGAVAIRTIRSSVK